MLKYVLPAVRDVERAALQRHQALAHQLGAAVDEPGLLGAVDLGPVGHARQVGLVVLAEVGGVGVGDRALARASTRRRPTCRARPRTRFRPARRRATTSTPSTWVSNLPAAPRRGRGHAVGRRRGDRPVAAGERRHRHQRRRHADRDLEHAERRLVRRGRPTPTAITSAEAPSAHHGRWRTWLTASSTITSAGTNGSTCTTAGRGSPRGPEPPRRQAELVAGLPDRPDRDGDADPGERRAPAASAAVSSPARGALTSSTASRLGGVPNEPGAGGGGSGAP